MPIYMKIEAIPGGSHTEHHPNWFELYSFHWGETNLGGAGGGGGGGSAGRVQAQDFAVVKQCDKGSPRLFHACAKGRVFPEVVVDVTAIIDGRDVLKQRFNLSLCTISNYEVGGDGGSEPIENMSLSFARLDFTQVVYGENGEVLETQTNWWDFRANRGG